MFFQSKEKLWRCFKMSIVGHIGTMSYSVGLDDQLFVGYNRQDLLAVLSPQVEDKQLSSL